MRLSPNLKFARPDLTFEQISFDAPNYFTMLWGDDYEESRSNVVRLSRNPHLFALIYEYLSGYDVSQPKTLKLC
jgi:hypothetical protein